MKRKGIALLIILSLMLSVMTSAVIAAEPTVRILSLIENWNLTEALDLEVSAGEELVIDGGNRYYIYEMSAESVLINSGEGIVRLKDTILYPASNMPQEGTLGELTAAASSITSITSPSYGTVSLSLPEIPGFETSIKSTSNEGVIGLNGAITSPLYSTTVNLVLSLTGNGGVADTSSISVIVPGSASLSITTATLPAATVGVSYSQTIAKSYTGSSTVTFSATGLPGGLSINENTGVISGVPASGANANSPYTVSVTASDGILTDAKTYSIVVSAATTGGDLGGGGVSAPSTPAPIYKADISGSGTAATLPVAIDTVSKSAAVSVDTQQGNIFNGRETLNITIPAIPNVISYILDIPVDYISRTDGDGVIIFNTDIGSMSIPENMLADSKGSKVGITIGQGDRSRLSDKSKAAIGNRPLVQLTLMLDGKQIAWNNPGAQVEVSIPYTPTATELANTESIIIWYIDGSGNTVSVPNGYYDPATGTVTYTTTHFSDYAVGYNKENFNDVSQNAWYSKAVSFIAARGITGGTGGGKFSPEGKLKRGEFLVMLMKSYEIAQDINSTDNFTDAGNTYYTGYLAAAKRLGISSGVGNNMFTPEKEITRQEMFTLLYNALRVIDRLPQGNSGKTLSDYSDSVQVESWAKGAMTLLVETGAIGGNAGKLTPVSFTTRSEMAQVLYNLLAK